MIDAIQRGSHPENDIVSFVQLEMERRSILFEEWSKADSKQEKGVRLALIEEVGHLLRAYVRAFHDGKNPKSTPDRSDDPQPGFIRNSR